MIRNATQREPPAGSVDVIVIGAGHAGLAVSRCLSQHSIDHLVLERGEIANSWRQERWDSLRLLTPNWQSRLPGYGYAGPDRDGYRTMPEVIGFIEGYAQAVGAPVRTDTTVTSVTATDDGYCVVTDRGLWRCRAVVMASGAHNIPLVPAVGATLPESVQALTAKNYRNPGQLDERGVLIVGASATGLQLADEIQKSGRRVTLAVGEHIRMPRVYRGMDIQYWLDALGILDERYDEVEDLARARHIPSPQLVGTPQRSTLDLNALTQRGIDIVGRLVGVNGSKLQFSGSLNNHCAMADLKLSRLLQRIDDWAERCRKGSRIASPERFAATRVESAPRLGVDLQKQQIGTVIWATGFRPDYSWLHVPAFDRKGGLRHEGGIVDWPGLYALGLNFMRRRKSSFIHGAEDDVRELGLHLAGYLRRRHGVASRDGRVISRAAMAIRTGELH
jgi:putative flavoprotein involved in K+ transport